MLKCVNLCFVQDFLNMFFKDIYKPIPLDYNLVTAMLWRHPENVDLSKVKVVHYCAAVSWKFSTKLQVKLPICKFVNAGK